MEAYNFSNNWFETSGKVNFENIIPHTKPAKILEIGSYEGRSLCYLIETLGNIQDLEIHAIDSWEGGADHVSKIISGQIRMVDVEDRFKSNVHNAIKSVSKQVKLATHKGLSDKKLSEMLAGEYKNYFDFIYVDGSHETSDTLCDMSIAFRLLKKGGMMAIDDYLWKVNENDPDFRPKLAIDAFINLHLSKLEVLPVINTQAWLVKK